MAQIAVLAVMALAALNKGAQERKVAYREAEGLRDASQRRMAAATAEVSEGERQKEEMYSRALAVSAASGAGTDAGIVNVLGDLNAEGDYRIFSKLYVGSTEAEGIRFQSEQAMRAGDAALEASYVDAAKTVISSYGSYGEMWAGAGDTFGKVQSKVKSAYNKKFGATGITPTLGSSDLYGANATRGYV